MSPEDVLDLARRATTLVSPEDAETALAVLLDVWVETCTGTFLSRAGYDPELARQRNLAKVFVMCWDLLSKTGERPSYCLTSRNGKAALKPKDAWVCLPFDVRPSQRDYLKSWARVLRGTRATRWALHGGPVTETVKRYG